MNSEYWKAASVRCVGRWGTLGVRAATYPRSGILIKSSRVKKVVALDETEEKKFIVAKVEQLRLRSSNLRFLSEGKRIEKRSVNFMVGVRRPRNTAGLGIWSRVISEFRTLRLDLRLLHI